MSASSSHRPPHGGYPGTVRTVIVWRGWKLTAPLGQVEPLRLTISASHRDPDGTLVIESVEPSPTTTEAIERAERRRREILERHLTPDAIEIIDAAERELERRVLMGEPER